MEQLRIAPLGIAPDLVPETAPVGVWTLCSNVYPRDGMERAGGIQAVYGAPLFAPKWLLNTASTVAPSFWVYGADTGIGGTDGAGSHVDLTPAAGFVGNTGANCWTGGNLNGVPVLCNGGIPVWWNGLVANDFVTLPGWPANARARAIRPYKYHLIALAVDPSTGAFNPDLLWWSSAAVPGAVPSAWVPAPANEAGSAQLSATPGAILDGVALRDAFVIYKEQSCYSMQYVGGANVMQIQPLFTDVGTLARNCVAELDGTHVVLTDGDVIFHDGQTAKSIADSMIRRTFLQTIDRASIGRCFVVPGTPASEVWIAFPDPGETSCTRAAVWDRVRSRWGVRDLTAIKPFHIAQGRVPVNVAVPLTWAAQTETWSAVAREWGFSGASSSRFSKLAAGAVAGAAGLYALDQDPDTLGGITRGFVQRNAMDFGNPDTRKIINRVWLSAKGPAGTLLAVQVGGTMNVGEAPVFGDPVYCTIGGRMDAPIFSSGRYLSLRVSDASVDVKAPWVLTAATLEYRVGGMF